MNIYKSEIEDGLEEQIKASASITYASLVEKGSENSISASQKKRLKAQAGVNDKDLYYTQSILVTTDWNKNDDIFDSEEVWAAKDTPIHKPTNLEHKETEIVGHITANWPITQDGIYIDQNTPVENLPDRFHILTASVIYKGFTDPELSQRANKLIAEIEEGTKYVSMECFFNGFDYGLTDKSSGEFKVLARNEETAFLTKHLRSYGGMGEHENYKIGRVLRNITFSGKGFVDKPANPESIIFDKEDFKFENVYSSEEKNDNFNEQGVFSSQAQTKEAKMNSEAINPTEKGEAMSDCSEMVKEAYASVEEVKAKASEVQAALEAEKTAHAETKAAFETVLAEKEEAAKMSEEDMKKKKDEMEKMKAELDAANEVLAAYKSKEEEMKKKEAMMKRKASLLEAGLDEESATSNVEKFESLDDKSFDNMVSLLAMMKKKDENMMMKKKEEEAMMMKKKMASESEDISEALETAEPSEEVDLTVASEEVNELENTRAALVDFVYNRLGKTPNK
jgi:hypothetical protein